MKKKLDSYTGLLNAKEITKGINAARENAYSLLKDAKILFEASSYSTSLSIAILAIEEAGKISILRGLSTCKTNQEAREAWKEYRSHQAKNAAWIISDLVIRPFSL